MVDASSAVHDSTPRPVRRREATPAALASLPAGLHPVLRRVLAARHVTPAELEPSLPRLIPVGTLPGIDAAVERLMRARADGERVVIVGDFDADGATATALMVRCLRAFGYGRVGFLVPDRLRFGYGLSPGVAEVAAVGGPGLLVTVDNGIASVEGVARAAALGLDVVVTDHHLPGTTLPAAAAITGPTVPGTTFASPSLCGVGVAFYVLAALGRALAAAGLCSAEVARRAVTAGLDLVALGTVADVVALDFNNRILVAEGLRRIRSGRCSPGIAALFAVAGRDTAAATAADLGFAIAPRLNAAGRLADMTVGVQCLLADDPARARTLAAQLHALNAERRELQARTEAEALALLGDLAELPRALDNAAVTLFDESWHPGIVGLVAGRLRERSGRPAVAFARDPGSGMLRGSARSVPGVHIRDCIAAALREVSDGAVRFGGHAMAAGLTLPEALLPGFRAALSAEVHRYDEVIAAGDAVWTDGPLDAADLTPEFAEVLAAAGPWGSAFPEPLFDNTFEVLREGVVGGSHLRLTVRHPGGGDPVGAIAFGMAARSPLPREARLVYRLEVDRWRQRRAAQLVVEAVLA
ncbi:MAG: single-stranded-DNA-specific exonuclease RecJ [Chromatiales bacterium]|jgi:single-stranded-DNA-specific exonuclease|nr:single-stranded-DNA-specific exonuclease RecJ [Chromatiales bacterium]